MDMMWYTRRGLMVTPHIESVTGATASFNSDYNKIPIKSLICDIEPIQDLHGYDSPWPAGGGKNLLVPYTFERIKRLNSDLTWNGNEATVNGVTVKCILNSNGTDVDKVTVNGTSTADINFYLQRSEASAYADMILSGIPSGTVSYWEMYYSLQSSPYTSWGYDLGSGVKISSSASGPSLLVLRLKNGKTFNNMTVEPMMRHESETDGTFAPYENICPISGRTGLTVSHSGSDTSEPTTVYVNWETEAGNVYGGELDAVSGKLVVDRAKITFDGSQPVGVANWRPYDDSSAWLYRPEITPGINNATNSLEIVCDKLKSIPYEYSLGGIYGDNIGIGIVGTSAYSVGMRVPTSGLTTAALINAWLAENPITVVYKLATPTEIQLTHQEVKTLLGVNNIWCDSGNVSVDYWKWGK